MKKRVLIIEDKPDMRRLVRLNLEAAGYEILESGSADEGAALAIKEKPDIVLLDIRLPHKKKGIGVARKIRENEETRGTPIIFVTGYPGMRGMVENLRITDSDFLAKPFDMSELVALIEKYTNSNSNDE